MITWGILAGLTAMVTGETSFAIVRFLLGVAEAGFFPGMIFYFTYWFPAKRYGWGWGLPVKWQGWAVLAVFLLLVLPGIYLLPPAQDVFAFAIYIAGLIVAFVAVCYVKGEPPAWHWGDK